MDRYFARTLVAASLLLAAAGAADATDGRLPGKAPAAAAEGGVCPVDPALDVDRAEMMARLAAKLREAESAQGGDVVVLNGRGYRYQDDRVPQIARELQILEVELQRAKAAARQGAEGQPHP